MPNKNDFFAELEARLPGLNSDQALSWASSTVKHLAQYLDPRGREELAKYLPSCLAPVAQEGDRLAALFGNEKPGDFFLMATIDAAAPPSKQGSRATLANVLAAIRHYIPELPAQEIAKGLPEEVAELWSNDAATA